MKYRELGRTGWKISEISFGAWAIGGTWGKVDDKISLETLHSALDLGVNFFDTADVYGDGRSEKLLARLKKERGERFYIATKAGRRLSKQTPEGYSKKNLSSFINRSLKNLNADAIDLLQLHCPPTQVYYMPEVFGYLDEFVEQGKILFYGVSVEKVEEAVKAIEYPNVQSVQIIFNMFRQRPADIFFDLAKKKKVGILARLPLSSGMLTGKFNSKSKFENDDHRKYNRKGEQFDRGETFSGIDFNLGLKAVDELRVICPPNMTLTQFALKWILMFDAVTCAIPGAKTKNQVIENVSASKMPKLTDATVKAVTEIYNNWIKQLVHHCW